MYRYNHPAIAAALLAGLLAGCAPSYSPDTYSSNAVQQASKVDQGVVVGVRPIQISAQSGTGTLAAGAAGGIAGSQIGEGAVGAMGALGGSVVGGLAGTAAEHATEDTTGFEYIVRKTNGDLLSVTQKDLQPLKVGQHVLLIEGPQARIVPDYTVAVDGAPDHPATPASAGASPSANAPAAATGGSSEGKHDEPPTAAAATTTPTAQHDAGGASQGSPTNNTPVQAKADPATAPPPNAPPAASETAAPPPASTPQTAAANGSAPTPANP